MNKFKIKLDQKTLSEARESIDMLLNSGKRQIFSISALKGNIDDSGNFVLSSKARGAAFSEFVGKMIERDDGVYLEGFIRPNKEKIKLLYALIIFNTIFGITLMFSKNAIFILFSIFFIIIPYINIWLVKKGNYLRASLNKIFKSN